jgi:vitamin B12 transporter
LGRWALLVSGWPIIRSGPSKGLFHGTKIRFNFANGYQEPSLDEQFGGLYDFLLTQQGGQEAIQQFHISPIGAEQVAHL